MKNPANLENPIVVIVDETTSKFIVEDDDPALFVSPPNLKATTNPLLKGLDLPTELRLREMSEVDKQRWLEVLAALIQRGVNGSIQIVELTGLSNATVRTLLNELKESWSKSLSPNIINVRREQIYLEAERVKEFCWNSIRNSDSEAMQLKYLQLILAAGQRQSSLIGAERPQAQEQVVGAEEKKEESINLSEDQLRAIGDMISKELGKEKL